MGQSKEERNQSKSSLQDPKPEREECLFSTQLISQENQATEINRFEGNGLEWLCSEERFLLLAKGRILRGKEGNNLLVHACPTTFCFFFFFLSLFSFFLLSFLSFIFPCFLFCDSS